MSATTSTLLGRVRPEKDILIIKFDISLQKKRKEKKTGGNAWRQIKILEEY